MSTAAAPVLVTGATGRQGGATARALLAGGTPVRALVRDPDAPRARAVERLGAVLSVGDLTEPATLEAALDGVRAVFSVQMPAHTGRGFDFDGEVRQAEHLMTAARAAGVEQFVQSSTSGVDRHVEAPGWAEGRWAALEAPLGAKAAIQARLRELDFPSWTLIKPSFFMENFEPSMGFYFPRGVAGGLVTLVKPGTHLALVTTEDVGRAAAAAFADPAGFHRVELELAGDHLTMTEIAEVLSRALGVPLTAPDMTEEQARAAGMGDMGATHAFMEAFDQPARPRFARALGIDPTGFEEWARTRLRTAA
ncbi:MULTISPECIES: NmrA family NAD(P)-binding protein [Kitasatospora]|uniref:Putative NmrA family protein n=1 Tax=Kitasatospora setae (strain ATCC 33774 / DSM 43861 / JCM 3304 / KCC A-0304 / NBRC 14216 / KM-6054) TaxID=452652 RepID=E4N335_KITSK|nr:MULTISPECIES: NmrA family NAD(P)-binding protein [Kitasatospora]BAJ32569.1 putative NmrA family protein [Kitasatospora setae KM-6054]